MDFKKSTIPNMEAKHVQMLDGQVLPPLKEKVSRSPISLYSKKRDEYYERLTRENDEFNDAVEKVCVTERARFNAEDAEAEARALKKYKIFKALKTAALASPVILALFAGIGLFSNLYTYDVKSDGLSGLFITLWVFFSLGAIICSSIFVKNLFQKEVYHSRHYIIREAEYSKMSIIVASVALALGIVIAVLSAASVSKQDGFVFVEVNDLYCLTDYKGSNDTLNLPEHHKGEYYKIKAYAFEDRDDIEAINIPDDPVLVEKDAFKDCTNVREASVPCSLISYIPKENLQRLTINGGDSIGGNAFLNCSSLTSVTIPDSVTSIGGGAFSGCSSLTSVIIPDSVTSIGWNAFDGCASLTNVTIPDSVTSIGGYAFRNCTSLTSVTIPDSVTSIGSHAFSDCTSLTSVTIPDSVTEIEEYAFSDCTSLTSVTIPNSATSIGDDAFRDCTSLTSVTIGDSVTSIGNLAFSGCTSLTIYCEAESQPSGWNSNWKYGCNATVVWGYKGE